MRTLLTISIILATSWGCGNSSDGDEAPPPPTFVAGAWNLAAGSCPAFKPRRAAEDAIRRATTSAEMRDAVGDFKSPFVPADDPLVARADRARRRFRPAVKTLPAGALDGLPPRTSTCSSTAARARLRTASRAATRSASRRPG